MAFALNARDHAANCHHQRIVGLPGERIKIAGGRVYANGRALSESDGVPPIHYEAPVASASGAQTQMEEGKEVIIGPDAYFVLGDNSPSSFDSRYWGTVPAANIVGKATLIYYPFSRLRRLP